MSKKEKGRIEKKILICNVTIVFTLKYFWLNNIN